MGVTLIAPAIFGYTIACLSARAISSEPRLRLGFVPMWLKSRESASRLSEAERHLNLARVQNALASAAIDTR